MGARTKKRGVRRFDPEFRFLRDLDLSFEGWRLWAAEYWSIFPRSNKHPQTALTQFFTNYLYGNGLHTLTPSEFFATNRVLPVIDDALGLATLVDRVALQKHSFVSDFLDWVLREKLAEDVGGYRIVPAHLTNPFPRRQPKRIRFTPDFRFLLEIDPTLEVWRIWATEYWATLNSVGRQPKTAMNQFLANYLHGNGLHTLTPSEFFAKNRTLPNLDEAMNIAATRDETGIHKHDTVSDFLDWILREKLAEDVGGYRIVPAHLANPFPRKQAKHHGKQSSLDFFHVLKLDHRLEGWRSLAAEWIKGQKRSVSQCQKAIDKFLVHYIHGQNLERNYGRFLMRETEKPDFAKVMVDTKSKGSQTLSGADAQINNHLVDFLDWVLKTKLSDPETGEWDRSCFHNPVERLTKVGLPAKNQSDKVSLSIRYIHELREMLAEGPNFRDWTWAQQAMESGNKGGDWFEVDPSIIDPNDPDCVFRFRVATYHEMKVKGRPTQVCEMWSPVRSMLIYIHLELPLRNFQIRMLDSGEADTWRYIHSPGGGRFEVNTSTLATGSEKRPYQRGVFHRSAHDRDAVLFINTNKTADINKSESGKGYVIPWAHGEVMFWLEKLRNWQERYNPIAAPTPWTALKRKHFGQPPPHPAVLAQRGSVCFLFRDPTVGGGNEPLRAGVETRIWYRLLEKLERRCAGREETVDNGVQLRFVKPDSEATYFSPHSMRVSLISYFVLDLKLPIAVVSKMIAGHASIIMTLYYTKFGKAYMREVLSEAEKNELEAEQSNHRRFLMETTFDQVNQRFAYISEDAVKSALRSQSAAAFVFDDKGICPNGATLCDVGGEKLRLDNASSDYAPVSGFPQERNCVCCRFFLTGPAFLPGLTAHFNTISEKAHRQSGCYSALADKLRVLEDNRRACEREDHPFLDIRELERLSKCVEYEALILNKYMNDLQATNYLIQRSIEIANAPQKGGVELVAKGSMSDLRVSFTETQSVLHQLEVVCENAVIYPDIDAGFATIRRAQMLDAMLLYNGMAPAFVHLTQEQQLLAGNALMKLIEARTGSIKGSLPYAECKLKLKGIGLLREDLSNEIARIVAGVPAKELIDHAKFVQALALATPKENDDAS